MLDENNGIVLIGSMVLIDTELRGIPRVFRNLVQALINSGHYVVPIQYNRDADRVEIADDNKIRFLLKTSSIKEPYLTDRVRMKELFNKAKFFILPDAHHDLLGIEKMMEYCKNHNIASSAIFYDAIPLVTPTINNAETHLAYMKSIYFSDIILSISEWSKNDYMKFLPDLDSNKIKAVHLPYAFSNMDRIKEKNQDELNQKEINIIYVSSMENRKRHPFLVEAFSKASEILLNKEITLSLTLVASGGGDYGNCEEQINKSKFKNKIKVMFGISNEQLKNEFEKATFSVFPSEYEGFGLPLMESLYFNRPCIVANNSSLIELNLLGGSILFDTHDMNDLVNKIVELSENKDLYNKLVDEIKLINFRTWDDYSNEILTEMRKCND